MANRGGGREVAGMKSIGNQFECHGSRRQRRCLVDEFVALGILDPELAKVSADAVDCSFVELGALAVASFIHREFDGRRTAIQNQDRQRRHEKEPLTLSLKSASLIRRPAPVANLGQVIAVFGYIQMMALNLLGVPLARGLYLWCEPWHALNRIKGKLKAVNIVEYAHVEGRGSGALFFVTAHVKVVM